MTDWIEWKWTPEKPYPETLDTMVFVKLKYIGVESEPDKVKEWDWTIDYVVGEITHYRIAED